MPSCRVIVMYCVEGDMISAKVKAQDNQVTKPSARCW